MAVVDRCEQQNQSAIDEWSNHQMYAAFAYWFGLAMEKQAQNDFKTAHQI